MGHDAGLAGVQVRRLDAPIITADTHPSLGDNISGPSLIEVPTWVPDALGRYYLYFAHHKGDHIRLAYADELDGPWTIHPGGALTLADSRFLTEPPAVTDDELEHFEQTYSEMFGEYAPPDAIRSEVTTPHIASPDVRVNESYRTISMYFHGLDSLGVQLTRHATSIDGVHFDVDPPTIDGTYLRAFRHNETDYALVMPGTVLRRAGRPTEFEVGPTLLPRTARHSAVHVVGDHLRIFWTRVGDTPERILLSVVDASLPWEDWSASDASDVMRPELPWEGADEPLEPSTRGAPSGRVNQLRDPAVFESEDAADARTYLLCSIAGESGLALNELHG